MLISMAAALFTVIATELTHIRSDEDAALQVDPLRLIEAGNVGVAFLAAGSIILRGSSVHGMTTGASMWLAGAIGLCCGTGKGMLALIASAYGLLLLRLAHVKPIRRKAPAEQRTRTSASEAAFTQGLANGSVQPARGHAAEIGLLGDHPRLSGRGCDRLAASGIRPRLPWQDHRLVPES